MAIVTGGATGIGQAIALTLARSGADVAFTHLRHDPGPTMEAIAALGRRALAVALDATDSKAVEAFISQVVAELGRVDIVVNNAGGLIARHSVEDTTDEHWQKVLDVNLTSAFYVTREASRHLLRGGRVIFISSLAGRNGGGSGAAAYAASKAGIHGLTRALSKELAARGITVNAVAPGFILDTPFHEEFTPPAAQEAAIQATPIGRAGTPDDVAAAVLYLASGAASFSTGLIVDINGGSYFA